MTDDERDADTPRQRCVDALREMAEWLRGDERMINAIVQVAHAFADLECNPGPPPRAVRVGLGLAFPHENHAACREAILKEIGI